MFFKASTVIALMGLFSVGLASPLSPNCICGQSAIVTAAKSYGCQDGDIKCACNGWDAIKPGADEIIGRKCAEDFDCALDWALTMCGRKPHA